MGISAGTATPSLELQAARKRKHRTLWGDAWAQFRRNKLAMFGLFLLALIIIGVLSGPMIYRVDPKYINILEASQQPTAEHPFGTDDLGRDMLARTLYGGRISLSVGFTAMLIAMLMGTVIGLLAGYVPQMDNILMRFTDMMLTLPQIPLLLVAMSLFRDPLRMRFGLEMGAFIMVVTIIGVFGWMPTARMVRGSVLSLKQKEFVEAAVNVGARSSSIMVRHILPNTFAIIIVSATLTVATAILTESTLSFLGVGFPPDVPTWGSLLYENRNYMVKAPWMVFYAGLLISLTILAINFIGDGLRDALDPRQRG
ncbi:MAG: ABC transporter permease [Caldilineaceae bacterium]|nr:ABC transporter permease [Caldilineaceae bacterium]